MLPSVSVKSHESDLCAEDILTVILKCAKHPRTYRVLQTSGSSKEFSRYKVCLKGIYSEVAKIEDFTTVFNSLVHDCYYDRRLKNPERVVKELKALQKIWKIEDTDAPLMPLITFITYDFIVTDEDVVVIPRPSPKKWYHFCS